MTVAIESHGKVVRILLSGNIDYSRQEELRAVNKQALADLQAREIQVDFTKLTFLDSSVIRALVTLQKEADSAGKSLVLLNCNDTMREIFDIGGFDRMFTFR